VEFADRDVQPARFKQTPARGHPHRSRNCREYCRPSLKSRLTGPGSAERVIHTDPGGGRCWPRRRASLVDKGKPDVSRGRKATGPTRSAGLPDRENVSCVSPPSSLPLSPLPATEMSILVAHASKHGATGEIAERIAEGLRAGGRHADARPFEEAGDLADYEGFVIGSSTYSTHWLRDASAFVRDNRDLLAQRPVWLFSGGPLGAEASDAEGVDRHAAFEPREICGFQAAIHPRDHRVFFGALEPGRLSFAERSCLKMAATRATVPYGDFREWAQIEQWAAGIAQELTQLDTLPLQGAIPCNMRTKRTPSSRSEGCPVAPDSMRRTSRMNTVGGTFVVLGLLTLLLGAPLTLMLAWSSSGTFSAGVTASALVAGLGILMLVANWAVLGLGERTPAERNQNKRERDAYEAANEEYRRAGDEMLATPVPANMPPSPVQDQDELARLASGLPGDQRLLESRLSAMRSLLGRERPLYLGQADLGTGRGLVAVTPTRLISALGAPRIVPLCSIQRIFRDELGSVHVVSTFMEFGFRIVGGGSWDLLREVVVAGRIALEPLASSYSGPKLHGRVG
jgi:menaquinone-dependent protoporphyrinogen oxidase